MEKGRWDEQVDVVYIGVSRRVEVERSGATARVSWAACLGEQSLVFTCGANIG